ncbi:MAG TPA: bile acid:sodium symporter [Jiangellaceae bacterium]
MGLLDRLSDGVLLLTLWSTGIGIGMSFGLPELLAPLRQAGLVARVVILDVAGIPLIVWALVHMLSIPTDYAIGLLLIGFASAGPLGIKAAQIAGADVAGAVSLVAVLEAANALAIPVWVALLMPPGVVVPLGELVATLAVFVLLPLALGMATRTRWPQSAQRWAPRAIVLSNVLLVVVIVLVVGRNVSTLREAFAAGIVPLVLLAVAAALVLGWLAGGPARATRAAVALVTGVRANALALGIARTSFSTVPAVSVAVVTYGVMSALLPLAVALAARWVLSPSAQEATSG